MLTTASHPEYYTDLLYFHSKCLIKNKTLSFLKKICEMHKIDVPEKPLWVSERDNLIQAVEKAREKRMAECNAVWDGRGRIRRPSVLVGSEE